MPISNSLSNSNVAFVGVTTISGIGEGIFAGSDAIYAGSETTYAGAT